MPIQTNLSPSPYFDDYSDDKNFHRILFKPGVAVQVRELNQLQRILQTQVERFGDNIFKRGTIIDGCNFTFLNKLTYAKLKDNDTKGAPISVSTFKNYYAKDPSSNLTGVIVATANGYESTAPDLNTIFVRFINSGTSFNLTKFSKNTILNIYNANNVVEKIAVNEGGSSFSNDDPVVILSAIAVVNSTGGKDFNSNTWVINSAIKQGDARAEVLEVNTTANSIATILKVRPLESILTNAQSNSAQWKFSIGDYISPNNYGATTANSSATAVVTEIIGTGATAGLITDASGKIITITATNGGRGYYVPPYVSVFSNTGSVGSLNLISNTILSQVTVQNDDTATGNSYGVAVSNGVIYQKGHFIRVSEQLTIVEKYATTGTPDDKVVGFDTVESFIDYNEDTSLLDNASGSLNYTAPGADRLQLTPALTVLTTEVAASNTDFLPLIEFNNGQPFRQQRQTQYNKIQDQINTRTFEQSGNFVTDAFQSVTTSPTTTSESNTFNVVIDTGTAYIKGARVDTQTSFIATVNKGTTNVAYSNVTVDVNYGNYFLIKETGGYFQFNTGDVVDLYDTAQTYLSNTEVTGTTLSPTGTKIGTARMKSLVFDRGAPGTDSAVYRLYVFNVVMNANKNIRDIKSVYYNGATYKGYGDILQDYDPASGSYITNLNRPDLDTSIFNSGFQALSNLNSISYRYRSSNTSSTIATNGNVSITIATGSQIYSGELSASEMQDLVVIPLANAETANVSTANVINTNNIISLSNAVFFAALKPGDYLRIFDTSGSKIRRIVDYSSVAANGTANTTSVSLDKVVNLSSSNTGANIAFICPRYVPVQLSTRTNRSANISGSIIRVYLNPPANFTSATNVSVTYNAKRTGLTPTAKTTSRNTLVKLNLSTHASGISGPWPLGVNDIFRLRNVYKASSSSVNTNSTNVTNEFFIDHNQNENFYDVGYLYKKASSTLTLTTSDYLLVQFDCFVKSGDGIYSVDSYTRQDTAGSGSTTTLAALTTSASNVHTLEIPEMYDSKGNYFDLIETIDFRLNANNTANLVYTYNDANITTNPTQPSGTGLLNTTTEKYFPLPVSDLAFNTTRYTGRTDNIVLNSNGNFVINAGTPEALNNRFTPPSDSILINTISIPPYPSIPSVLTANTLEIIDKKISNVKLLNVRQEKYKIKAAITNENIQYSQPTVYTMTDIGSIDRRLKNIEYRVDLKELEDNVKDKAIKSSANTSLSRFKFGFFVDNFTSTDYSDLSDPEYSALNFNGRVTVSRKQRNIKHKYYTNDATTKSLVYGKYATLPYEEYAVVRQSSATTPPAPVTATTTATTTTTTVTQQIVYIEEVRNNGPTIYDQYVTFSSTAGPAVMYFGAYGEDRMEIYQSTTQFFTIPNNNNSGSSTAIPSGARLVTTSENAQALTQSERNRYASINALQNTIASVRGKWLDGTRKNPAWRSRGGNSKFWMINTGQITWTHDPTYGKYYLIRVRRGTPFHEYRLEYPVDATVNLTNQTGTGIKAAYNGKVKSLNPGKLNCYVRTDNLWYPYVYWSPWYYSNYNYGYYGNSNYVGNTNRGLNIANSRGNATLTGNLSPAAKAAIDTVVAGEIRGLKPNTLHDFYFGNDILNSQVTNIEGPNKGVYGTNTVQGGKLLSDDYGIIKFRWYYSDGLPDTVGRSALVEKQRLGQYKDVKKVVEIKSFDEISFVNWTMLVDYTAYSPYYFGWYWGWNLKTWRYYHV